MFLFLAIEKVLEKKLKKIEKINKSCLSINEYKASSVLHENISDFFFLLPLNVCTYVCMYICQCNSKTEMLFEINAKAFNFKIVVTVVIAVYDIILHNNNEKICLISG